MTESPTAEALRQQADAALQEADTLARRASELPGEIESLREEIRRARVNAARAGTPPGEAAPDLRLELDALEAELEDLPERVHAAREAWSELSIAAESALVRELAPELEQALADLQPLVEARRAAEQAEAEQEAVVGSLRARTSGAKNRRQQHEEQLQRVNLEGAKPLV